MRPEVSELSAVIRRIEAKTRLRPPLSRRVSLEEVLDGAVEETERGRVLVVRRRFDATHRHGRQPLAGGRELAIESLPLLTRNVPRRPTTGRLLYVDAESTGLAGGTGTYAFLVGAGFFDGDAFEIRQFFMRDLDDEPALLAALDALFRSFDGLVTFNGTGFDLPLLETRFVLARRPFPGDVFHVDLLGPARRLWSARLPDCRLGTLEQHVLRFARDDDLPGFLIPSVYFEYLRRKHPGPLARVFEHNRHDILSLAALTGWVAAAIAQAPEADLDPEELAGVGRLWEMADVDRGLACYRTALDRGLETPGRERVLLRLAAVEKRRTRWDEACALWEAVIAGAGGFDPRPWEEIAKVHEHRRRDLAAARRVVEQALGRAHESRAAPGVLAAFGYRLERLTRRLGQAAAGTERRRAAARPPLSPAPSTAPPD